MVELSSEQQAVNNSNHARIQVIACAGSGKTEAMAQRIVRLVSEGAEPAAIVAFTFTTRAAAALKARVLERYAGRHGEEAGRRLGPLFVGTIHGYCFRLLQEYEPRFSGYDVLDEHRLAALLSREHRRLRLRELGDGGHWAPIRDFVRNADAVESELIPESKLTGAFADSYAEFRRRLDRYRLLTYGGLITQAAGLLEDREAAAKIRSGLRHVIVDEYQDVNPAQEQLIQLLAAPPVHLCVVGDDDQAIYQWRGSDVRNIIGFRDRNPGCETLPISVNRRSTRAIIGVADGFVRSVPARLSKAMRPAEAAPAGIAPVCWMAENEGAEAAAIADQIARLHTAGYAYREIAVLFRSVRTSARPLTEALTQGGIPFTCKGRTGLFLQPEARLLGRTYAWLADEQWKDERFGEGNEVRIGDVVAGVRAAFGLRAEAEPALRAYLERWRERARGEREGSLIGDYYRLLNLLGVARWNLDDPAAAARMGVLARFSELLADFEHIKRRARFEREDGAEQYRGGQAGGPWFYRQLFNYMQHYALDAYEDFGGEENLGQDAVEILTVHQAKGLEWPVVFVPALKKGRFPSSKTGQRQTWLAPLSDEQRQRYEGTETDERRLFYVAMTRAREALYLSTFERTAKQNATPSRFFTDVAGKKLARAPLPLPPAAARKAAGEGGPAELAFSDLEQYARCPKAYRLRNLLGFEPPLARELGYGRAVHAVLRALADLARTHGRVPSEAEAEAILEREFYLPFANKASLPPMKAAARALIQAYRHQFGEDLLRTWDTERPFTLTLPGALVQGRADVILDGEGGKAQALALADYKTAVDELKLDEFQLAVYAAAAHDEGLNVCAAYIHDLSAGAGNGRNGGEVRRSVPVGAVEIEAARKRAGDIVKEIAGGRFPARPARNSCQRCDVQPVCGDALTRAARAAG